MKILRVEPRPPERDFGCCDACGEEFQDSGDRELLEVRAEHRVALSDVSSRWLCTRHYHQFCAEAVTHAHEVLGVRNLQWAVQSGRPFRRPAWYKDRRVRCEGGALIELRIGVVLGWVPTGADILATDYVLLS